jgi:broad specificity phosphatase PhoE
MAPRSRGAPALRFPGSALERAHADARHRFAAALDRIASDRQGDDLVVVSHGTVITAHVARRAGLDAFALWRRLGLPSYVVLSLPEGELLEVVEEP